MTDVETKAPTLIQSLQRGLRLIDVVAEQGPMTAKRLSTAAGIGLPTTYRLLCTLVHEGYLGRVDGGGYAIGEQLRSAGEMEGQARVVREVRVELRNLRNYARGSACLGMLEADAVIISHFVAHPQAPKVDCWTGMPLPAHATAIGKSVLAQLGSQGRRAYLAKHALHRLTNKTITDALRLEDEVAATTAAETVDEFMVGLSCVAAPLDVNDLCAAVGIAVATSRFAKEGEYLHELAEQTAARIARIMRNSDSPIWAASAQLSGVPDPVCAE